MGILTPQQYLDAVKKWEDSRGDFKLVQNLFKPNSVFNLHHSQIEQVKNLNKNNDFCVQIGVSDKEELIIIPVPVDDRGGIMSLEQYPYSAFEILEKDLYLTEKKTYTVVKKSVLSTKMRRTDSDSDIFFPVINKPVMEQEKALEAIESWQNNGMDWFSMERKNAIDAIFTHFMVPAERIFEAKEGIMFVTTFGLKYSEIYQKLLPALIFISAPDNLSNESVEIDSNTLDFAKPCPPY